MGEYQKRHANRTKFSGQRRFGRVLIYGKNRKRIIVNVVLDNLSRLGLGLWMDSKEEIHIGNSILLEFRLPGGKQIACKGNIVRIEKHRKIDIAEIENPIFVAIEFTNLPDEYSEAIEKKVEQLIKEKKYEQRAELIEEILEEIEVSLEEVRSVLHRHWKLITAILVSAILGTWLIVASYKYGETEWWKPKAKEWYDENHKLMENK